MTDHVVKNLFRRAVKNSKWSVLRGYHVLRHGFASNLAAGTDQRVIDELMGHTTEEMRKRYRHLFPEQKDAAEGHGSKDQSVDCEHGCRTKANRSQLRHRQLRTDLVRYSRT